MLSYMHPLTFLTGLVRRVQADLILLSPFATVDATEALLSELDEKVSLTMVVRWSKRDIVFGSSDLGVAKVISAHRGKLLRNPLLHAKLFMFDKDYFVFGSANITSRGLAVGSVMPNIECISTASAVRPIDVAYVNKTIREAQVVDKALLEELRRQIEECVDKSDFDEERILRSSSRLTGLFISDFPYSPSVAAVLADPDCAESRHDVAVLNLIDVDLCLENIREKFRSSPLIKWLRDQCDGPLSFGEISHRIHNAMLDDPKPYRKEIKVVQANMYRWIEDLLLDEFRIWTPEGAHSELIVLRESE
jgi:hypothetical protein